MKGNEFGIEKVSNGSEHKVKLPGGSRKEK